MHIDKFEAMRDEVFALHNKIYALISSTQTEVQKQAYSPGELVDMGLLCREMETFLDEGRKEVKTRRELCGKLLAMEVAKQAMTDPSKLTTSIRGSLGSASPDVKQQPKLPKKGTDEYIALMKHLGLSDEVIASGCIGTSWNGMKDYISKLVADGKKLPPGIVATYPIYTATFRRRTRR